MVSFDPSLIGDAFVSALSGAVQTGVEMLPSLLFKILGAIAVLFIGFLVSAFVGRIVSRLMDFCRVEISFKKFKVEDALGGTAITPLLSSLVRWYVMLLFLQWAVAFLDLPTLTGFITKVLDYVPVVIGAMLLVLFSALVGEWVREALLGMHKFYLQDTVAHTAKWLVMVMGVVVGLDTVGFHTEFIQLVLGKLLEGVTLGVALAFGLAFGFGGQKDAADIIRRCRKSIKF